MRFVIRDHPSGNYLVASPNAVLVFSWFCHYTNSLADSKLKVGFTTRSPDFWPVAGY